MSDQTQNSSAAEALSFEQALAALEQIVHVLEEGRLGLAESLGRYEEGVKLLKQCHGLLERAERRIELLTGVDASGNPVTEPFDDGATMPEFPQQPPRSRRGGKSSKKSPTAQATDSDSIADPSGSAMDEPGSLF